MPRIRRLFQPPLPVRGATPDEFYVRCLGWFQPTLPLRGATVQRQHVIVAVGVVSTHAPLAGSDLLHVAHLLDVQASTPRSPCGERHHRADRADALLLVSTHAPLAGSDGSRRCPCTRPSGFSPRSPCGERLPCGGRCSAAPCFNPRSPCGERHLLEPVVAVVQAVSTHAPLAGSDPAAYALIVVAVQFQPTLPLRGATTRGGCRRGW